MKPSLFVLVISGAAAGCVTVTSRPQQIIVPPIHVVTSVTATNAKDERLGRWMLDNVYGPDTLIGELWFGCMMYYDKAQRWPRSREEIQEGFSLLQRRVVHLPIVTEIVFREEGGDLAIDFSRYGEPIRHLKVMKPKLEEPNKSPEPTPGSVIPRATSGNSK